MKIKNWLKMSHRPRRFFARVVCLLLAVVMWLFVMYVAPPEYSETYRDISVTVLTSDEHPDYAGRVDSSISVRVWGTKEELLHCNASNLYAYVEISDLAERESVLSIGKTYEMPVTVVVPEGLEVRDEYFVQMLLENR